MLAALHCEDVWGPIENIDLQQTKMIIGMASTMAIVMAAVLAKTMANRK